MIYSRFLWQCFTEAFKNCDLRLGSVYTEIIIAHQIAEINQWRVWSKLGWMKFWQQVLILVLTLYSRWSKECFIMFETIIRLPFWVDI